MRSILEYFIKDRLGLVEKALSLFIAIILSCAVLHAQNELDVIKNDWLEFTDAPNSLYHYISGQAYEMLSARSNEIARISSLQEWQQRQKKVRETLFDIIGPFPHKTPLNARTVRKIEKDGFRVENIIFESQPGFYVTSSLFIPSGLKKNSKSPAVIYCSGHSTDGYRSEVYQHVIINLVLKGFIVFAFDPVGQGERLEYFDKSTGKSIVGGPTTEHSYPGTQAFITGSSQARYMIWDGIRAVDYLLSRQEVDSGRIGITGRSGGGTQSAYIAAMDDRIYASAPECYITTFTRLLQTMGNQDAEQNLFNEIVRGIDQPDLLAVRAPKPALMITTTRDIFSIQGAVEAEKEVSLVYKAYGRESDFGRAEDDTSHASTRKNREAMYAFFQKHLKNPGNPKDEPTVNLTKEEMQVTSSGQVSTSLGGETVFSLNRRESDKQVARLDSLRSDPVRYMPVVLKSARNLSGYKEPNFIGEPVFSGRYRRDGYVVEKYFIKGEGNYVVPYLLFVPSQPSGKAVIYLHPSGKSVEASAGGEMEWFVRKGFTVLAPDMVGTGETGPGVFQGDAYIEGGSHNLWYASMLIGRSIAGIRAADVVMLARLLRKSGTVKEIYEVALKEMAPVALYAAAFEPAISRVALIGPYSSYQSIVRNRFYASSFIPGVVPGALREFDLPDIAASLAPRSLLMAGVTDGDGKSDNAEAIDKDLAVIRNVYKMQNATNMLNIIPLQSGNSLNAIFSDWIK
jgi:hypothetical protein